MNTTTHNVTTDDTGITCVQVIAERGVDFGILRHPDGHLELVASVEVETVQIGDEIDTDELRVTARSIHMLADRIDAVRSTIALLAEAESCGGLTFRELGRRGEPVVQAYANTHGSTPHVGAQA